MSNDTDISGITQRALKCMIILAGHEHDGLANKTLTDAIGCDKSETTKTLKNLMHAGLAEQVPGQKNRWRLGPKLVQIALAHLHHIDKTQQRFDELKQRYSRDPS